MTNEAFPAIQLTHEDGVDKKIITVGELLSDSRLHLPDYQRPYKWTGKNIRQLFADLVTHGNKPAYRLGTIVFHVEDGRRNIVDGQQRTVSLMLTILALEQLPKSRFQRADLRAQLGELATKMYRPTFPSDVSKKNIRENYREIQQIVRRPDFNEERIDFLLNRCQFVAFTLGNISEAFQFFDSQNSRGRDLEPHDLLKAYHLREFNDSDESTKARTVAHWEKSDTDALSSLFAHSLSRIRRWSRGVSARYFGKEDISLFKGVSPEKMANYPFTEAQHIAHRFVDHYQQQYERHIDGRAMTYPFQLDQTIINGRRFFEMTAHYQEKIDRLKKDVADPKSFAGGTLDEHAVEIMQSINDYPGMHRTGDRYVRAIFDCLLIYYVDKFGYAEISRAIEKIFVWAYSLRLHSARVGIASIDNHVRDHNLFRVIKDAIDPDELIHRKFDAPGIEFTSRVGKIETLFRTLQDAN